MELTVGSACSLSLFSAIFSSPQPDDTFLQRLPTLGRCQGYYLESLPQEILFLLLTPEDLIPATTYF
jgi:hypothetical protein